MQVTWHLGRDQGSLSEQLPPPFGAMPLFHPLGGWEVPIFNPKGGTKRTPRNPRIGPGGIGLMNACVVRRTLLGDHKAIPVLIAVGLENPYLGVSTTDDVHDASPVVGRHSASEDDGI